MDEVTQQNAALVEENTAAAQSMVEQARALETLMSFFTLDAPTSSEPSPELVHSSQPKSHEKSKTAGKPASAKHSHANGKYPPAKKLNIKPASNAETAGYNEGWEEF